MCIIFQCKHYSGFSGVILDDELHTGHRNNPMEHEDVPDGTRTPPTPPARSPPPLRSLGRQGETI